MTIFGLLKYWVLGFLLQVMLVIVAVTLGLGQLAKLLYGPRFEAGEFFLPSTGPQVTPWAESAVSL